MRKNKPKETRLKEIIDTAVELFLKNGFEGTTMQSIADNSGLSKGGLYHHFSSKDEVLLAANKKYFEPVTTMMDRALEHADPAEALVDFINDYIKYWSMHQRELIFANLARSKMIANIQLWKHITEFSEMMTNFYEILFKKAVDAGQLRPHDYKRACRYAFCSTRRH